ncbi:MAG: hypothetical protein WC551_11160 [Patescibacteria group bacterium]
MKKLIIKQARQLMLRSLDKVYPSGLTAKFMEQVMCTVDQGYGFDLMKKDIAYLCEKGYIKLVGFGGKATLADIHEGSSTTIILTADGLEVAQNIIHDEALEL